MAAAASADAVLGGCFDVIDSDQGGTISLEEFKRFNSAQAAPCSNDVLAEVFAAVDADGSGEVDKEEFVEMVLRLESIMGTSMLSMAEAFERQCYAQLFKLIGDGAAALSAQELRGMVDSVNATLELGHSMDDIHRIFKDCDDDGSGRIELDEFENVMKAIKKRSNISHLLWAFNDWKEQARARMRRFNKAFGDAGTQDAQTSPLRSPRSPRRAGGFVEAAAANEAARAASPAPTAAVPPAPCSECERLRARLIEVEAARADADTRVLALAEQSALLHRQLEDATEAAARAEASVSAASSPTGKQQQQQQQPKPPRRTKEIAEENQRLTEQLDVTLEKLEATKAALAIRTQGMILMSRRLRASGADRSGWTTSLASEMLRAAHEHLDCDIDTALRSRHIFLDLPDLAPREIMSEGADAGSSLLLETYSHSSAASTPRGRRRCDDAASAAAAAAGDGEVVRTPLTVNTSFGSCAAFRTSRSGPASTSKYPRSVSFAEDETSPAAAEAMAAAAAVRATAQRSTSPPPAPAPTPTLSRPPSHPAGGKARQMSAAPALPPPVRSDSMKSTSMSLKSSFAYPLSDLGDLVAADADRFTEYARSAAAADDDRGSLAGGDLADRSTRSLAGTATAPSSSLALSAASASARSLGRQAAATQAPSLSHSPPPSHSRAHPKQPQSALGMTSADVAALRHAIDGAREVTHPGGYDSARGPMRDASTTMSQGRRSSASAGATAGESTDRELLKQLLAASASQDRRANDSDAMFALVRRTLRTVLDGNDAATAAPLTQESPARTTRRAQHSSVDPNRVSNAPPDVRAVLMSAYTLPHSVHPTY